MHSVHVATVTEKDEERGRKRVGWTMEKERGLVVEGGRKKERERERKGMKGREGRWGRKKGPVRERRRQINVRLMLLSTYSAAKLRILDSGAGLSRLRRGGFPPRFSLYIFPFPLPSFPPPSTVSPILPLPLMKTFARRHHFNDFLVRFFWFFSFLFFTES